MMQVYHIHQTNALAVGRGDPPVNGLARSSKVGALICLIVARAGRLTESRQLHDQSLSPT
jgi:hypothetical protein